MDVEDLIQEGITAYREGDRARAQGYLSKAVLKNPNAEHGWWWLGLSVDDPKRKKYCFQRVLALNPSHQGARQQLALLEPEAPRPAPAPKPPTPLPAKPADQAPPEASAPPVARRSSQRLILILLISAVLLVAILGGGYIFLDTTGLLPTLIPSSGAAPIAQPSPTMFANAQPTLPPTWTPTPSPTPRLATPTEQSAASATPQVVATSTPVIPTAAVLPIPSNATEVDFAEGTGALLLEPQSFTTFRFSITPPLELLSVGSLTFQVATPDADTDFTLELYVWAEELREWGTFLAQPGDTTIPSPALYATRQGEVIASLRNWGEEPLTIENAGFTLVGLLSDGSKIIYRLGSGPAKIEAQPTANPTPPSFD